MKKDRIQKTFLTELKRIPIVQVACEKSGISRNSIYRWRKEDEKFRKLMDKALSEGEALINDMSESQLLVLIKEKSFSAIRFWLNHRNPKFKDKMEVTTKVTDTDELTPHQAAVVQQALKLAALIPDNDTNNETNSTHNSSGDIRGNEEGQKSKDRNNKV